MFPLLLRGYCLPRLFLPLPSTVPTQCWKHDVIILSYHDPLTKLLSTTPSFSKLFVGGLCYDTNETVLKEAFRPYGEIIEVKVICDHVTGKSRGYGFVHFATEGAANSALKEMDGQLLEGKSIRVQYAHRR